MSLDLISKNDNRPVIVLGANSRLAQVFLREKRNVFSIRKITRLAPLGKADDDAIYTDYNYLKPDYFEGCRAVINFIGISNGPLHEVNVEIPLKAAWAARAAGVSHFVQISSLSVYGSAEYIERNTLEDPKNDYGVSKLRADTELAALKTDSFGITILRIPVLYGASIYGKIASLAKFIKLVGFFPVPRTLPKRSVLHVVNAAEVLEYVLQNRLLGIQFAADQKYFDLEALAKAINTVNHRSIHLFELPCSAFRPVAYFMPNLYKSLFCSSLLEQRDALTNEISLPITLEMGLNSLIEEL